MQTLPVYVISLEGAVARRAALKTHLDAVGIEYALIEAVNGHALSQQRLLDVNPAGNMSPGQVGCYLSHVHVYERIVAQGTPVALILEDDAMLHSSVKTLLEQGCQQLAFDYCFLGSDDAGDAGYVFYDAANPVSLSSQHRAYPLSAGPFCSHAYLITLEGAKNRLACAYPARSAIDHYRHLPYKPRLLAVLPMLAFVNELSAVQSMSSLNWSGLQKMARKYWWYYPMRDVLKLKALWKWLAQRRAQLPQPGRWTSFRSAFRVVRKSTLNRSVDAG